MTKYGKIRWFNRTKGYGFIIPEDNSPDVMIHVARIRLEVAAQLDNNVRVAYTDIETPKGLAAVSCELHIDDRFNVIELTDTAQPWRYAAQDKVTGIAELFADEQDLKMCQVETSGNVQQHSA